MKKFYIQYNIGKAKYVVTHHNGMDCHPDGSEFFNITIFKNKKKMNTFLKGLMKDGYTEGK